jgi:hypothetical protein
MGKLVNVRDTYLVKIDLDRLRTRLGSVDGSPAPHSIARHWLADHGYLRAGKTDHWVADDLDSLFEDEILFLQVANDHHGQVD